MPGTIIRWCRWNQRFMKLKKASATVFQEIFFPSTSEDVFTSWVRSPERSPMKTSWIIFLVSFVLESRAAKQTDNKEIAFSLKAFVTEAFTVSFCTVVNK